MSEPPVPIVSVRDVQLRYRNLSPGSCVEVLKEIDLDIFEGEFICIIGPSGCGKSTLLNILAGFLRACSGDVTIDGEPVMGPNRHRILIFQEGGVFPWLTVRQNIEFGIVGLSRNERHATVERYVKMVGLSGFEATYPYALSGGMRQRVELARALAANPRILFMDEPFGSLDYLTRLQMRSDLIGICQAEQKTVVFVTHDVDEALQLADRILVMSDRPATICKEFVLDSSRLRNDNSYANLEFRKSVLDALGHRKGIK